MYGATFASFPPKKKKKKNPSFWRQPTDHLSRQLYDTDVARLRPSVCVSLKALASCLVCAMSETLHLDASRWTSNLILDLYRFRLNE